MALFPWHSTESENTCTGGLGHVCQNVVYELTTFHEGLLWASPEVFLILSHEVFVGGQNA